MRLIFITSNCLNYFGSIVLSGLLLCFLFHSNLNELRYSSLIVFPHSLSYGRETTDSYTIAAAPNFESVLRGPSFIYSSFDNRSKSNLDIDGKTPFLSAAEGIRQSTWWEKASVERLVSGELPIGYGCSFTQTIFNGTMLFGCHLLPCSWTFNLLSAFCSVYTL